MQLSLVEEKTMATSYLVVGLVTCLGLTLVLAFRVGYIGPRVEARTSKLCDERKVLVSVNRWRVRFAILTGAGFIAFGLWLALAYPSDHLYGLPMPVFMLIGLALVAVAAWVGRKLYRWRRRAIGHAEERAQAVEFAVRRTLR